jgi:hypothetical protein
VLPHRFNTSPGMHIDVEWKAACAKSYAAHIPQEPGYSDEWDRLRETAKLPPIAYAKAARRVASTLSIRRPSMSTTSKRQPRVSTDSPALGKWCSSPMTRPATVS